MVKLVKNDIEMEGNYACPFCFSRDGFIYVQSHYQCASCKQVTDPCCGGEVCHSDERLKVSENNVPVATYCGSLSKSKGIDLLIHASLISILPLNL